MPVHADPPPKERHNNLSPTIGDSIMAHLYKFLRLFFCPHEWKVLHAHKTDVETRDAYDKVVESYDYKTYILECKNCGDLKSKRVDL